MASSVVMLLRASLADEAVDRTSNTAGGSWSFFIASPAWPSKASVTSRSSKLLLIPARASLASGGSLERKGTQW